MRNNLCYKYIFVIIITFSIIILSNINYVFAQTAPSQPIDTTDCTVLVANVVYTPFTVTIDHDPAVKKTITTQSNDPASALQLQGADPNKIEQKNLNPKTHLLFSSNDTDNWSIIVQLDHADNKPTPRTLVANIFETPQQILKSSSKVLYTGNHGCIVFQISSVPPIHIVTNQEIVADAEQVQEEKMKVYNDKIAQYAGGANASASSSGFLGLAMIVIGIISLMLNRSEHRKLKVQEENSELAEKSFNSAVDVTKKIGQYMKLEIDDIKLMAREQLDILFKDVLGSSRKSEMWVYNAIKDFTTVLQMKADQAFGTNAPKITIPEKPPEEQTELIPEPEKVEQEKSSIPIIGPMIDKLKEPKEKLSDRAQHWYEEYNKMETSDKGGKLSEIWVSEYPKAKARDEEARAKIDAILRIIEDNNGAWPN